MFHTIQTATESLITTITLNRPARKNAISPQMVNELLYALEAARNDAGVRVVVLTGGGEVFCSGGDLGQMAGGTAEASELPVKGDYSDLLLELASMPKPVIARVRGAAKGGGLGLVAASHFAVAASDAVFGTPELNVGLFPMMIMAVLARTMPKRQLLEMMLTTANVSAHDAAAWGIVTRSVPAEHLDREVKSLAENLASRSPTAVSRGLAAYAKMGDLAMKDALPMLRDELYALLGTDDAREGLMAFMEKRQPRWSGR
ncbi:MAG: enoyl-CoA hydratase/isomerase family protein [Myxococcales bacterium]|nr:enoyl-CoA hydratase/isomerase family protein [Myxococcales bacterium]